MIYVKVEDGEIIERSTRPTVKNVSSPNDEILKEHGWLPLERETLTPASDETVSGKEIVVEEDKVIERTILAPLSEEEILIREKQKELDTMLSPLDSFNTREMLLYLMGRHPNEKYFQERVEQAFIVREEDNLEK